MRNVVRISDLSEHVGGRVTIQATLTNDQVTGTTHFLTLQDGSGMVVGVAFKRRLGINSRLTKCEVVVTGEVERVPGLPVCIRVRRIGRASTP